MVFKNFIGICASCFALLIFSVNVRAESFLDARVYLDTGGSFEGRFRLPKHSDELEVMFRGEKLEVPLAEVEMMEVLSVRKGEYRGRPYDYHKADISLRLVTRAGVDEEVKLLDGCEWEIARINPLTRKEDESLYFLTGVYESGGVCIWRTKPKTGLITRIEFN